MSSTPFLPMTEGTEAATPWTPYSPLKDGGHREDLPAVAGDGRHDPARRGRHAGAGVALPVEDAEAVLLEGLGEPLGVQAQGMVGDALQILLQRQAHDPDGAHQGHGAGAMLPHHGHVDGPVGDLQEIRHIAHQPGALQEGAGADDLPGGLAGHLLDLHGDDVQGIGDADVDGVPVVPDDLGEDLLGDDAVVMEHLHAVGLDLGGARRIEDDIRPFRGLVPAVILIID